MFHAFTNDTQSLQIDDLTIENQYERINLYGNLQIHRDQHGLRQARQLQSLLNDVVQQLEQLQQQQALPEHYQTVSADWIDNPFN